MLTQFEINMQRPDVPNEITYIRAKVLVLSRDACFKTNFLTLCQNAYSGAQGSLHLLPPAVAALEREVKGIPAQKIGKIMRFCKSTVRK